MKFLIIGASGFIGSHILKAVRSCGYGAVGTRASSPRADLVAFDLRYQRIADCVPADFWTETHPPTDFWTETHPPTVVLCSCISQIDRCYRERDISREINVEGTIRLLDDLKGLGSRTIFLSSSHVFDGEKGEYTETDSIAPQSEYGRQKAEVEQYLQREHSQSLVLRLDKVVGADPQESHLFSEWLGWMGEGKPFRCIADQVLSPTLVDDIAQAVITAQESELFGLYHVANPERFSRAKLASRFLQLAGGEAEVVVQPVEAFSFDDARPLHTHLDSAKFRAATGFTFTPMDNAIRQFLHRGHGKDTKES